MPSSRADCHPRANSSTVIANPKRVTLTLTVAKRPQGQRRRRLAGRSTADDRHRLDRHPHQSAVDQADEEDEAADPDGDRVFQGGGNRMHHGLAEPDEHQQGDDDPFHQHDAPSLPATSSPSRRPADTRRPRSAPCREPGRRAGSKPGPSAASSAPTAKQVATITCGNGGPLPFPARHAGERQDRRVHKDDVRHDHKGRDAGPDLAPHGGLPFGQPEQGRAGGTVSRDRCGHLRDIGANAVSSCRLRCSVARKVGRNKSGSSGTADGPETSQVLPELRGLVPAYLLQPQPNMPDLGQEVGDGKCTIPISCPSSSCPLNSNSENARRKIRNRGIVVRVYLHPQPAS